MSVTIKKYDSVNRQKVEKEVTEVDDSGWLLLTENTYYRRKNGVVVISFQITVPQTTAWTTLATLPEGYRPARATYGCLLRNNPTPGTPVPVMITAGGSVMTISNLSSTEYIGSVTFPV